MTTTSAIAVAAVLLGATVQSAIGFGYAIVAAPVLAATAGAETAAPTLALIGIVGSGLLLVGERRPTEVLGREVAWLVGWSLPGLAAGVAVLAFASSEVLTILVACAVLLAVGAHVLRVRALAGAQRAPAGVAATAGAGMLSGALTTTTGLNGPPLVLHLLGRSTPSQRRDTLAAIFLIADVLGLVAFAVTGTLELAPDVLALVAATAVGWALGRRAFGFLHDHHDAASLLVLALSAIVALALAVDAVV